MDLLFMIAVLPGAALLFYIYKMDPIEKEPTKLLVMLAVFGVLSTIPAVILELCAGYLLSGLPQTSLLYYLLQYFLGVALVEELCKFVFLYARTWRDSAFDYLFDGIVYAVFVSLGFAIAENISYVFEYGFATGIVRAVTAVPGHAIFAQAKKAEVEGNSGKKASNLLLALVVPVLLHGAYDFLVSVNWDIAFLLFLVLLVAMAIAAFRLVKREATAATRISNIHSGMNTTNPFTQM